MGVIEDRLAAMGPELPAPPGVKLPFELVRVHGDIAYVFGHARSAIGSGELPFGMPVEVEAIVSL